MSSDNFFVSLPITDAFKILDKEIVEGSLTGERIDYHVVKADEEHISIVAVYEKYYNRAGNRLTLTICMDNMKGITQVHSIGGGGGQGLFRFDWGASDKFTNAPRTILGKYIIQGQGSSGLIQYLELIPGEFFYIKI